MELFADIQSAIDAYYTQVYTSHLLPPLVHTMKNTNLSILERTNAIKYLADGSLALTAVGSVWSAALSRKIVSRISRRNPYRDSESLSRLSRTMSSSRPKRSARRVRGVLSRIAHRNRTQFKRVRRSSRNVEIESRVRTLQGLIPGGRQMNDSMLLTEAADYVMFLKFQVGVLQSLASAIEQKIEP